MNSFAICWQTDWLEDILTLKEGSVKYLFYTLDQLISASRESVVVGWFGIWFDGAVWGVLYLTEVVGHSLEFNSQITAMYYKG